MKRLNSVYVTLEHVFLIFTICNIAIKLVHLIMLLEKSVAGYLENENRENIESNTMGYVYKYSNIHMPFIMISN